MRCVDSEEELGTFLSAVVCMKHEGGFLLPRGKTEDCSMFTLVPIAHVKYFKTTAAHYHGFAHWTITIRKPTRM